MPAPWTQFVTNIDASDAEKWDAAAAKPALLSGTTAPLSGSGMDPLDGVNNPWRWWAAGVSWVGPAVTVSWQAGDVVPSIAGILPAEAAEIGLVIGSEQGGLLQAVQNPGQFYQSVDGTPTTSPTSGMFVGQAGNDNGPLTAIADGAGIAFLYQYETGYTGPTAVPDASLDVTVLLGDVTVTGVFVFPEGGDGRDGDFWLDVVTADLYGPKAGGVWPPPLNIRGFDSSIYHTFTGGLVLSSSDPAGPPLALTGGPEPDVGYLNPGQVAVWFDPTPGTGGMRFKMVDTAGTVTDVSLP